MSEISSSPSGQRAQQVRAMAASWLIECRDSENWTLERQSELDAWLDESPAHRVAYLRLAAAWSRADRLASLRSGSPRQQKLVSWVARATAAVAALSFLAFLALNGPVEQSAQEFSTGLGGHKTLKLRDGSQIELNTDTALRLLVRDGSRSVWLDKGEAYFDVRHNAAQPFIVDVGRGRIVDLGTKFTVKRDSGRIDVAVVEGRARFDTLVGVSKGQSTTLVPGDKIVATATSTSKTRAVEKSIQRDLSWRKGVLTFDNMTLAEVAATFNRYNRQKLVIAGADVQRLTVVGTFRTDGVERFSRVARDILGLQTTRHGDEIIVSH